MGNSSSSPKINKTDQAIFKLKLQRDSLIKYNTNLGLLLNKDIDQAKIALGKNDKQRALLFLKKKKAHLELLGKTLNQIDTLEELISNIQFKLIEKDFVKSLNNGNKILTVLNQECSVTKVEEVLDKAQDQIELQNEVDAMISQCGLSKVTDEEIEDELRDLEKTVVSDPALSEIEKLPKTDNIPIFPQVGNGKSKDNKEPAAESHRKEQMLAT